MELPGVPTPSHGISFRGAARVWMRVALLSFGGPAGQIAVMHRILVEEKRWISEGRFLHALNYCMLLPGPEAQQLATYIGWLLHQTRGGLVAGILFVLPGFVAILLLSILYTGFQDLTFVQGIFFGLKPAVMAVVVEALVRIGRRALRNGVMVGLAALAFIAIFFLEVRFPLIILGAALVGLAGGHLFGARFLAPKTAASEPSALTDSIVSQVRPTWTTTWRPAMLALAAWLVPVVLLSLLLGTQSVLTTQAIFFSKAAMVTFGGAYAVLAYIAQEAVETYGWLRPGEMLDGLGLAETTPGPLIMVVQFVGFVGAYRNPGLLEPVLAGVLGSIVTTWVTFAPCFFWIFLGAPYVEYLRGKKALSSALSTITAAVVGVILNLAVWFSLHTLFHDVDERFAYGIRLLVPLPDTLDLAALVIAAGAFVAIFRFKIGMLQTLGLSAAAGLLYFVLFSPQTP